MATPFFNVPLNLPHASTVASRILYHLNRQNQVYPDKAKDAIALALDLADCLRPFKMLDGNPPLEESKPVVDEAARLGRLLVDAIESGKLGDDRIGQAIRNLFECLALGQEGAQLSLRAGENPDSALRAV